MTSCIERALAPIPKELAEQLQSKGHQTWMVTGCAGFIGSNIVENLLACGQQVIGVDNLSTGHLSNLESVQRRFGNEVWGAFKFSNRDINDSDHFRALVKGCDYVLHQAALGSVPRSIKDPLASFEANVRGFVNVLDASRQAGVKRFVYASSSSVYGDHPNLPKIESQVGRPLSPYAATKVANELFAEVYARSYGLSCVGLRYFNVFGPRQDPEGAYAAVIPKWIDSLLRGERPIINGDGQTSRDFCFVANAVQANLLAALSEKLESSHEVFNVAFGQQTSLDQLFGLVKERVSLKFPAATEINARRVDFREGDIRHSLASIEKARAALGYRPEFDLRQGLELAMPWYLGAEEAH